MIYVARRKDADPQALPRMIAAGGAKQVKHYLASEWEIEKADEATLIELHNAGVKIEPALPNNATVDQE